MRRNSFISAIFMFLLAFVIAFYLHSYDEGNAVLKGRVVKVIDGDTIRVFIYNTSKEEKIRLKCIDFPDLSKNRVDKWLYKYNVSYEVLEKCYYDGKELLESLILNKEVFIYQDVLFERDKYGRLLGYVVYNNTDINEFLVSNGYAIPYICKRYGYAFNFSGCLWQK